jgi:hypothetical protein
VQSLDDRRVYEIYPGAPLRALTDFEGRQLTPGAEPGSLVLTGPGAQVILRWRFAAPASVTINDRRLEPVKAADGSVWVQFDQSGTSGVKWQ